MQSKYVLIRSTDDSLFCEGIFDCFEKAISEMMFEIWDRQNSFLNEGDVFHIGQLRPMEGDSGYSLEIQFKDETWNHHEKEWFYVLESQEDDGELSSTTLN